MTPSKFLRRFLDHGTPPPSQKEAAALLDESRSILLSKLPTTGEIMNSFTEDEHYFIMNGKGGTSLDRSCSIIAKKRNAASPVSSPPVATAPLATARPAPVASQPASQPVAACQQSQGSTLERNCEILAAHRKTFASKPVAPRATATAAKPAPSPITTTASAFAPSPIRMELAEFRKLNASQKMSYVKAGGKLI